MNFKLTDDQRAVKRTARELLGSRYRPETMRALAADKRGFTDEQWQELSELGWPGVIVPDDYGGFGLGAVELVVLHEEIGYALAPSPLLSTISAALVINAAGTPMQKEQWLPPLASGEKRGTLAVWEQRSGQIPNRSELEPAAGCITGTKIAVPDAGSADVFVVSGADGRHFLVQPNQTGVEITAQQALDPTRKLFAVQFTDAPAQELQASPGIAHAYATIVTALAAENVGVAQRALEMAVAYAKARKQFGRPIGSYQAVSHRCAQMLLEVEGARSLCYWAGWALDNDRDTALRAASMAKAYASDAGYRVTASALQVHGGIGFTWEHDLHFFFKRARANGHAFGDARWHRDRVAELAGL